MLNRFLGLYLTSCPLKFEVSLGDGVILLECNSVMFQFNFNKGRIKIIQAGEDFC
jgi:hypothetical protein